MTTTTAAPQAAAAAPHLPSQIEHLATATLVPYARNSRTHSPEQVAAVARSIQQFGFTNPVLIDAHNTIIAGHGRVMAAQSIGLGQVPCIRLAHLTDAQRRAYVIADNKLAELSGWDMATLAREVEDLMHEDAFDIDLLGFGAEELEALLSDNQDKEQETQEQKALKAEKLPEMLAGEITKAGDVWLLGKHRVMCGDSTPRRRRHPHGRRKGQHGFHRPAVQHRVFRNHESNHVGRRSGRVQNGLRSIRANQK